jgi:hypothetical protein
MHTPLSSPAPRGTTRARQHGVVLIWTAASLMLVAGIVLASVDRMRAVDRLADVEFNAQGQARQIALAGLTDAKAWLRRCTAQPVTSFTPQRDPAAPPPPYLLPAGASGTTPADPTIVNETEQPEVGLVRTFEIAPGLWGRYSVIRGSGPEPFEDANGNGRHDPGEAFTDSNGDGHWTGGVWTRDVTTERGLSGAGGVWLLIARGQVFRRADVQKDLGEGRNRQLAEAVMATEVRRLTLAVPAEAALISTEGRHVQSTGRVQIRGDTVVAYPIGTGSPVLGSTERTGINAPLAATDFHVGIEDVFGVTLAELQSMADISTSDPVGGLPDTLPRSSLVVITGDVTFDHDRPLRGSGIVVVKGNVTLEAGSNSFFEGFLYVDGDLYARSPCYLRGSILVTGTTDFRGTGGDYCEIEHDPDILGSLLGQMGQYRQSKAPYEPMPLLADGSSAEVGATARRFGGAKLAGGYSPPVVETPPTPPAPPPAPDPAPPPDPAPAPTPPPTPPDPVAAPPPNPPDPDPAPPAPPTSKKKRKRRRH